MKKLYDRFKKKHLGLIILAQSLIIVLLVFYIINLNYTPALSSSSESTSSEQISKEAATCLSLDPSDRPACAKIAGVKIKGMFSTTEQRFQECMKFRPLYIKYCQEGLTQN
mgnify:CR=1 FL=1